MNERWRWTIVSFCVAGALMLAASFFGGILGYGGFDRVGLWGMQLIPDKPFTFVVTSLDPGEAADRGGIVTGDVIDMRMQPLIVRFWILNEPVAGRPITLHVLRGGSVVAVTVVPHAFNLTGRRPDIVLFLVAVAWMLAFAALLVWRKAGAYDVRLLSLVLVCLAIRLTIVDFSFTSPALYVVQFVVHDVFGAASVVFWALYCACFARPLSKGRLALHYVCIGLAAASVGITVAAVAGETTLRFSSEAYLHFFGGRSELWHLPYDFAVVTAIAASLWAMAASKGEERQRAIWALVPLSLLFAVFMISAYFRGSQGSYNSLVYWIVLSNAFTFVVPVGLTYAALGRRLLDVGFVINRALIFGLVSAIVVCVFLAVEWGANEFLVNASRTTGTIFSMAVALALGLSMRPIHRWADRLVDEVFFRKRHEDEAALRGFAREAAYITDRSTLVERAIAEVREHADATAVSLLVADGSGRYVAAGKPDDGGIDENDRALVAMRTWHKPVDLDTLETELEGEYAFPMMSRGRLVGALVCGAKSDGESYAPDESSALSELAHGVGTALDLLGNRQDGDSRLVLEQLADLNRRVDEILRQRV